MGTSEHQMIRFTADSPFLFDENELYRLTRRAERGVCERE